MELGHQFKFVIMEIKQVAPLTVKLIKDIHAQEALVKFQFAVQSVEIALGLQKKLVIMVKELAA